MKQGWISFAAATLLAACVTLPAIAANVKVTPLGGKTGEFCRLDRALMFEDPDGTRILYDPGMTIAGADDPRLGAVDAILITHMHGDHVGARHNKAPDSGACAKPDLSVVAVPNTNAVNIAVAKNAKIVSGSEMPPFFAGKIKALGGDPKSSVLARFGATKSVGGVRISTVPASHSNGLVTYLSGDTGITAEQDRVVRGFYGAKLAVMNIGDTFTTGPKEAAYVINQLVKPAAVIASHANEEATKGGQVVAGSRTDTFRKAAKVPVHIPLSGRTMEFNADGKCAAGC